MEKPTAPGDCPPEQQVFLLILGFIQSDDLHHLE